MVQSSNNTYNTLRNMEPFQNHEYPCNSNRGKSVGEVKECRNSIAILVMAMTVKSRYSINNSNVISKISATNETILYLASSTRYDRHDGPSNPLTNDLVIGAFAR